MRVLFLLLFIACTANSQICVKWRLESLDKSGFSICVHSDNPIDNPTDNVTNARLRMTKAATWSADEEEEFSVSASRDGVCLLTTVLDPSQAYLVDLGLYDGVWSDYTDCQTELATFDCNSFSGCDNAVDADGGGAGTDLILEITTPAGAATPTTPNLPSITNTLEEITESDMDNTVTVTVNGSGECTNLQDQVNAQITAMAAAGTGLIYGVKIPHSSVCRPEHESLDCYTFNAVASATNKLVVYSEYPDPNAHSPHMGLIHEDASIASIEPNLNNPRACNLVTIGSSSNTYRFQRIRFASADFTLNNYPTVNVTAVSGAAKPVLTLDTTLVQDRWGTASNTVKAIVNVPGMYDDYYHGGTNKVLSQNSESTWAMAGSPTQLTPSNGTNTSGGSGSTGTIHRNLSTQFTSASSQTLSFSATHGYSHGHEFTITSLTSDVLELSVTHGIDYDGNFNRTYYIEGSNGCDGFYPIAASSGTQITLTGAGTCSTPGTVKYLPTVMLHNLSNFGGITQLSCAVKFPTTTTAEVVLCYNGIDTAYVPDFTSATGWLAHESPIQQLLLDLNGCTNCEIEQCIFDSGDIPYRYNGLLSAGTGSEGLIIQGSWVYTNFWFAQHPYTKAAHMTSGINTFSSERFIDGSGEQEFQVLNNSFVSSGYIYQDQNGNVNKPTPAHHLFDANRYYTPEDRHSNKSASGGAISGYRHAIQYKAGLRVGHFNGLSIDNPTTDNVASAYAINIQQYWPTDDGTYVRGMEDITITNSWLSGAGGWSVGLFTNTSGNTGGPARAVHPSRLKIDNNIFEPKAWLGQPTGDQRNGTSGTFSFSPLLAALNRFGEVAVTQNTFLPYQGGTGANWNPHVDLGKTAGGGGKPTGSVVAWTGNLIFANASSDYTGSRFTCNTSTATTWAQCIAYKFQQFGTEPSPDADFSSNKVVAAYETSAGFGDPDVVNDACSSVTTQWTNDATYTSNFPLATCSNGQSLNTRMDVVFNAGTLEPSGSEGATLIDILRAQGRITEFVHQVTSDSIIFSYKAPDSSGVCKGAVSETLSPAAASSVSYASDAAGSYDRELMIEGLNSGTLYYYLLACAEGVVISGSVQTN